ncbi:MAG: hypothetical protein ACI32N_02450 [Bulleidia sp.]
MNMNDLIFYILDVVIIGMLIHWHANCRKIVVETKIGAKWIIPALFLVVAVIGFFKYQDTPVFRIVQTAALVICAGLYYTVKSGLSDEGIVMMGALTKWEKAGSVTLNKKEACVIFKLRGKTAVLYFDPDQLDEVRNFLAQRSIRDNKKA